MNNFLCDIRGNGCDMWRRQLTRVLQACPWTLAITSLLVMANFGLIVGVSVEKASLADWLEFDRQQILAGEWWRLVTGHLVHWSAAHAALDIGAFLLVGLCYERRIQNTAMKPHNVLHSQLVQKPVAIYPALLLVGAGVVSLAMLLFDVELERYRGFSGLNSAQFAAVLVAEWRAARRHLRQLAPVAIATAIFATKIVAECLTGELFFGTSALGDLGDPVPLAHAAGSLWGVGCLLASTTRDRGTLLARQGAGAT